MATATLPVSTSLTWTHRIQRWLPFCLLLLGLLLFAAGAWGDPQPTAASEPKQQTVEQPSAASEPRIVSVGGEAVLINPPKNDTVAEESMPVDSDAQKFSIIEREFKNKAQKWSDVLVQRATWLFFTLGAISLTWTGIQMVFRKGDIADFFAETVRFILFFGFFLWLLQNGIDIGTAIIDSFVQLGESAGQTGPITPSDVILLAFKLWADTVKSTSQLSGAQLLAGILMLVLTTVFIALIAINFLLLKISVWLYLYAGIFVLGFGGSRWTSDMAVAYFKQLLNIGLQLMTMILMIGIAKNVMGEASQAVQSMALFKFVVLLLVAITLFILSNKVPQMVGSIAGGGSNGVGAFGGGAVMAATAAMTGAALELAGFAKAVRELKKDSVSQGGKNQGGGTQSETGDSHHKSSAMEALSDSGSADNSASQDGQPLIAEGNRNTAATAQATNVAGSNTSGGNTISSPEASGGKADSGGQKGGDAGGRAAAGQNDTAAAEGASKTIAMSTIQAISTAAGRILMNQTRGGKLANQIREERERRQQRERNPDHDPEA
ncbi:P-type conjugative transfer protein TrbL [Eikenella sp. NML01-A-086]|uniref:P-type conjugative transfer protein TrbL n=1 Tax=Eikenella sp. NML01-A-086 TaxID=1795826 RepID=UPI0009EDB3A0|nr:P-type conjugative transfer protein TrbL [Eikenella sp. NML01-A-086]